MAFDLVIDIENEPGALARVAAAISDAGVNIAAATCFGPGDRAELHILVPHAEAARHALAISHLAVTRDGETVRGDHTLPDPHLLELHAVAAAEHVGQSAPELLPDRSVDAHRRRWIRIPVEVEGLQSQPAADVRTDVETRRRHDAAD